MQLLINANCARVYSKLYIYKMGNGCKKPVKNAKIEEPVEAKEQVNDPQDQSKMRLKNNPVK